MRFSKTASRVLLTILVLFAVLTASLFLEWPAMWAGQGNVPADECGPIEPSEKEVKRILAFGKNVFASADWVKSYTVEPYKISVARRNDAEGAVAIADYLMFNCGYGQEDLDALFSAESFEAVFAEYESHALANYCEIRGLSLYEYDLVFQGTDFLARFWVKQDTDTRLLTFQLVFPKASAARFDQYSESLFPELSACR